jgi:hypothetical protein
LAADGVSSSFTCIVLSTLLDIMKPIPDKRDAESERLTAL